MPAQRLGAAHHRDVRAEREALLAQRRGEGVVHRHQRARGVRGGRDRRDVAHVELRVRRRLDPHEPRTFDRRADLLGVGGDELHLDAVQALLRHEPHAGIAVVHRHELVARLADRHQHGGQRRHAGSEHERRAALERAQRAFQRRPRRVRVPPVAELVRVLGAAQVERSGEYGPAQQRRALFEIRQAGVHGARRCTERRTFGLISGFRGMGQPIYSSSREQSMKFSRPSPSMVVASVALFVSLGGTSVAAINYATNAGAVDGKSAVFAGASLNQAAGKLVATNRSGDDKGRLPGKFVADVAKTQSFSKGLEVADNAPGAPQLAAADQGPRHDHGHLQRPERRPRATRTRPRSITFNNPSGQTVNVARRVGNGDGALTARGQPDLRVAEHRRLEHVPVPHRVRRARTRSSRAACARMAAGRPRPICAHLRDGAPDRCLARPVPVERDHLLDPARPVRVADRGRQQSWPERDPLRVRIRA